MKNDWSPAASNYNLSVVMDEGPNLSPAQSTLETLAVSASSLLVLTIDSSLPISERLEYAVQLADVVGSMRVALGLVHALSPFFP